MVCWVMMGEQREKEQEDKRLHYPLKTQRAVMVFLHLWPGANLLQGRPIEEPDTALPPSSQPEDGCGDCHLAIIV